MDYGVILAIAWLIGAFVGWMRAGKRQGWSPVTCYGGAVLFALGSFAALLWIGDRIMPRAQAAEISFGHQTIEIRRQVVGGCMVKAVDDGDSLVDAARECACVYQVIATGMTLAEYAELEETGDAAVLAQMPQMQRLRPAFQECGRPQ